MNTEPTVTFWTRTSELRVYWRGNQYKIQQKWISDQGEQKWEDLLHFIEPEPPEHPGWWKRFVNSIFPPID